MPKSTILISLGLLACLILCPPVVNEERISVSASTSVERREGIVSIYIGEEGEPLYCDRGEGYTYGEEIGPWIAVDVGEIESGRIACGDTVSLCTGRGCLIARVLDAGYLYYDRETGEEWGFSDRVIADVPLYVAQWLGWEALTPATMYLIGRVQ